MMMQERSTEVTVFDNAQIRNAWESRVNQYKEKETCENERRQKSALPQLFNQWHQRWASRNGILPSSEKKGKGNEISEFRKILELKPEEAEKPSVTQPRPRPPPIASTPLVPPLPKIPPLKKRDPEARKPPSTPKPQLQPPPKREEVKLRKIPKPEPKQRETVKTEREKIVLSSIAEKPSPAQTPQPPKKEVQKVQQKPSLRDWNNSWKYSKPQPHHKKKLVKTQKGTKFMSNRNKAMKFRQSLTDTEAPPLSEWIESWKFLKSPEGQQCTLEEPKFKESLLFEPEQEKISLNEWAESWKVLSLQLNQENESWEKGWSQYCQDFQSNKLQKSMLDNEQTSLSGWEESWKVLKPAPKQEKENIPEVRSDESMVLQRMEMMLLQHWADSWKVSNTQCYDDMSSLIEWSDSWRSCAVQDKCTDSLDSCEAIYMPNIKSRELFNAQLLEELPTLSEWSESWMFTKSQENGGERQSELNEDIDDPLSPIQSQKNTSSSKWKDSWKFSNANNEQTSESEWINAWKLSISKSHEEAVVLSVEDAETSSLLVDFQFKNSTFSMSEWNESSEKPSMADWCESWKTIKPQEHEDSEPVSMPDESSYQQFTSKKVDLSDWYGSWKLLGSQVHPQTTSPHTLCSSEWTDSWRLLYSEPHKQQEIRPDKSTFNEEIGPDKSTFNESFNERFHMEMPSISEWSESWKLPKSGFQGSEVTGENTSDSEWGASWKCVNPLCNLEGMPESQQDESKFSENVELSILSRGDRSIKCFDDELQLCLTEWNESWKLLKPQTQEQQEAKSK